MKINWFKSPRRTDFGQGMVIADIALTKDHTLTIYCEEEVVDLVNELFKDLKEYEDRTNQN